MCRGLTSAYRQHNAITRHAFTPRAHDARAYRREALRPALALDFPASAFANDESTVPVCLVGLAASPQNTPARMISHAQQDELLGSASELPGSASDSSYELAGEGRRSRAFTWQAVESLHLQGPAQTHQILSANVLYLQERMYQNTRVATSPKRKSKQEKVDVNASSFKDKVQERPAANEEEGFLRVRAHSVSRRQVRLLHNRSTGEDLEHRRCVAALGK